MVCWIEGHHFEDSSAGSKRTRRLNTVTSLPGLDESVRCWVIDDAPCAFVTSFGDETRDWHRRSSFRRTVGDKV